MSEGQEYELSGFDEWGRPVTETVYVQNFRPKPLYQRLVMRYAPLFMWNLWYRFGWTNWRAIRRIKVI